MILWLLVRILLITSIGNVCYGVPLLTTLLPSSSTITSGTSATVRPASLARGGAILATSDVTLVAGAATATGKHAVRAVNDLDTKSIDLVSSSMKKKENDFKTPIVHVHMSKNQKNNGNIQVYVIHVPSQQQVDNEVIETSEDTEVTEVKTEGRSNNGSDEDLRQTSGGFLQFIPSGIRRMFRALFSFDRRNFNLFNIFVNSNLHTA